MGKQLRKNFIIKIFAICATVSGIFSLSLTAASELSVGHNKTVTCVTSRGLDIRHNSDTLVLSDAEILGIKEHALRAVENASREIAELKLSEVDLERYKTFLPQNLMTRLYAVLEVSKLNTNPEVRVKTLMQIQGYNCQDYLITWFTIEVVEIVLKTSCHILPDPTCELALEVLRLADTVFFWATVLCYLGIV